METPELEEAASQQLTHEKLLAELKVRHLANLFIAISVLVVLGTTLYPFDFTTNEFRQRLSPFLHPKVSTLRDLETDVVTNIILFIPIGFSLAILTTRKKIRTPYAAFIVILSGAGLSLGVELLQLFLPFRFSSFFDVLSNAFGAGVGFVFHILVARSAYHYLMQAVKRGNKGYTTGWLVAAYSLYLIVMLVASLPLQKSSIVNEFNKASYPLLVGNEPTGDRPWSGSIKDLIVTRHGLSREGVADYFNGLDLNQQDKQWVVAHYVFNGVGPYPDFTKKHSNLEWRGKGTDTTDSDHAHITPRRWLQTKKEAYEMCSDIMESARFTICVTAGSDANFRPTWKARIATVSADAYHRNFSLVQIDDDLGIRFRSMTTGVNGTNPQFIVPDVFADTLMHRIIVVLNASHLEVYVDSVERQYALELGPGFALLNRFFPSSGRLDISSSIKNFHNYFFDAIVFVPLAYILALLVRQLRTAWPFRILVACVGIVAPPYLLELVLRDFLGGPLSMENLFLGSAIMWGTVILTLSSHLIRPKLATSATAS